MARMRYSKLESKSQLSTLAQNKGIWGGIRPRESLSVRLSRKAFSKSLLTPIS